ncbi:MAG: radical SAM protein [Planctomycetes bacterium]|nr:radical SAM protein [Planctomycetota bacterium]
MIDLPVLATSAAAAPPKPKKSLTARTRRVALIDLFVDGHAANREQTGSFGSLMTAGGLFGKLLMAVKRRKLYLPISYFGYLAAQLRGHGCEVNLYNGMPRDEDLVLIASSMFASQREVELARMIKATNPQARVGVVGAFAKARPDVFADAADFVIAGEPEGVADRLAARDCLDGVIESGVVADLESLPFPDWTGFPVEKYSYFPALPRKPFLTVLSSRGCPFYCPYCPYLVLQEKKWRKRGAAHVVDEIEYLVRRFGIRSFLFRDPLFSASKKRVIAICEEMLGRNLKVEWCCETRLDVMDEEQIDIMVRAGMRAMNCGIESDNDEHVAELNRRVIAKDRIARLLKYMDERGVKVQAFYIIGLVQDTAKSIRSCIDYAIKLNTFSAQFCVMTPFPGTKFYDEIKDRITTDDWSRYTEYEPVIRLDGVDDATLLKLRNQAYRRYYLRPSWALKHGWKLCKR